MLQPTPKRRMAGSPAPISLRPRPMTAESTAVRPTSAPIYGNDVAPGARPLLVGDGQPALGSANDYAFKERTKQYKASGAPDVSVSPDPNKRPYYNPLTKRLNISPYHGAPVEEEYLAELSHARQHEQGGLVKLALGAAKGALLPDSNEAGGRYSTPGTMEYNAHKEIEPALIKQWNAADSKGAGQAAQRQQQQAALFTQPAAERGFTPTFEPPMKKRMSAAPAPDKYADGAKDMAAAPPKKKLPTGSYAAGTTGQLQGPGSNQSQADLDMMRNSGANAGAALRQVAPVGNQSYQDFQRTRKSPQGQADKAAYEASNKLGLLTDADYQQRRFDEGTGQVRKMAQANPGSSVFSGAPMEAAYASQRDRDVRLGNYADTGSAAVTAGSLADRSAKMNSQTAYAAPGMAMNPENKDMGSSTPMKKKMGASLATYADGTKKVKTQAEARKSIADADANYEQTMRDNRQGKAGFRDWSAAKENMHQTRQREFDNPSIGQFDRSVGKSTLNEAWQEFSDLPKRAMNSAFGTKYADGSKKIKASRMAQDEAANERAEPSKMPTVTAPDMAGDMDTDGSFAARKMRATPKELPADRNTSPKKATDYKEAAAVLRSDKTLMAEYHEGVASGKAFSMSIGGKTFQYAATAKPGASKTPSAKPDTAKAGGKQAGDQDFAKPDPENPATAENASPSLRKMGMPGTEDYASGPNDTRPGINGGRVQNTPSETDAAWQKYAGVDPHEYDNQPAQLKGDIRKDRDAIAKDKSSHAVTEEQGLMQSYVNMSPKERAGRAGKLTYERYSNIGNDSKAINPRNGTDLLADLPVDKAKKKMKTAAKKG